MPLFSPFCTKSANIQPQLCLAALLFIQPFLSYAVEQSDSWLHCRGRIKESIRRRVREKWQWRCDWEWVWRWAWMREMEDVHMREDGWRMTISPFCTKSANIQPQLCLAALLFIQPFLSYAVEQSDSWLHCWGRIKESIRRRVREKWQWRCDWEWVWRWAWMREMEDVHMREDGWRMTMRMKGWMRGRMRKKMIWCIKDRMRGRMKRRIREKILGGKWSNRRT